MTLITSKVTCAKCMRDVWGLVTRDLCAECAIKEWKEHGLS